MIDAKPTTPDGPLLSNTYCIATLRPIFKKQILGLRLSRELESQRCQPNICFLLMYG